MDCLKKMDAEHVKLLIILDQDKFYSIISIGDVQRAIIKNTDLNSDVELAVRQKITVAYSDESFEQVRDRMLKFRTECMPVVDRDNNLIDIYFWEDVFSSSEHQIKEDLQAPVVIMAGGKGTRLKPITNIIPKPLVPIGEKPIMEVIIEKFNAVGVKSFHAIVNYKYEMIESYFSENKNPDYRLSYHRETEPLGTAGGLKFLRNIITQSFFVSNCDILVDQDYRDIFNFHKTHKNKITVVAALHHYKIPYGTLETEKKGRLISMNEKPEITYKINTGMYVLEPEVLDWIPDQGVFNITDLIEKALGEKNSVGVFPITERAWLDMGQWNEYYSTLRAFERRFAGNNKLWKS